MCGVHKLLDVVIMLAVLGDAWSKLVLGVAHPLNYPDCRTPKVYRQASKCGQLALAVELCVHVCGRRSVLVGSKHHH